MPNDSHAHQQRAQGPAPLRNVAEAAGRVPPQALDAERSILGAMLIEREAIARAIESLVPGSFYLPKNERIFEAICALFERGTPVDLITLQDELRKRGDLDKIGGVYYLTELTVRVASAANVEYHARIVSEKALLRGLITAMTSHIGHAYDTKTDAFTLLDQVESDIFRISESQLRRSASSLKSVIKDTLFYLETIHERHEGVTGITSGFSELDKLTGGWQNSDLIIIAARPSMGKTALALACARNAAMHRDNPTPVVVFSLEMSAQQLAQRLLTAEARVNAQDARTGKLRDAEWKRLVAAAGRLDGAPIFLDDTPALGILELRAKARRLRAEHDIALIVVDYLQLMHGPSSPNREQEIAQISRSLKSLAKELNIPVVALSQLNRGVETRGGDKRPQLSDLRESGSIEQDADVVAFIYRAERYGILHDDDQNPTEGIAEIIIGKQRNGPTGNIKLAFVKEYARFENLERYREEEEPAYAEEAPSPF